MDCFCIYRGDPQDFSFLITANCCCNGGSTGNNILILSRIHLKVHIKAKFSGHSLKEYVARRFFEHFGACFTIYVTVGTPQEDKGT